MATEHPKAQRQARRALRPGKRQFEEVLDLLYRRRRLILGTLLVVGSAVTAFMLTRPDVYEASAAVLIDLSRADGGAQQGVQTGNAPGAFVRDNRTIDTELFVLNNSRGIRERAAARIAREHGDDFEPAEVQFAPASRNVSNALQITALHTDPEAAAAWANAYATEYVTQTQLASRSYLTESRQFLEEQEQRLRGELSALEGRVAGQQAAGGAAVAGAGALQAQLQSVLKERDEAEIELRVSQARLSALRAQLGDISPRLSRRLSSNAESEIRSIDTQIARLQEERAPIVAYEISRGNDPSQRAELQRIDARLRSLEAEKARLTNQYVGEVLDTRGLANADAGASYVSGLQTQISNEQVAISGLQRRVSTLNGQVARLSGVAGRAPNVEAAVASATRDRETVAQTYELVAQQLRQTRMSEESEPGYARVLREAQVPAVPTGSSPTRGILLGLLGGLGLGLVLALARDKVDNRVHKPDHIAALGVSVLEAVPDLSPLIRDELGGATTIEVGGQKLASELVTVHAPLSPASETYRHLRTRVQFSRPGLLVRTVVVTSGGASEGKSTTAANLAITFAQAGRRTVLIDADLRRPVQHDIFGMAPQHGLAQLLAVGDTSAATLRTSLDTTFRTVVGNLYVVPTGAVAVEDPSHGPGDGRATVLNPSEMLGSADMRGLLRALLDVVDVVIVDTPPVLAATDAVLISTQADATLFVTCAGRTKVGDVEQSIAHLDDVGAEVIGAVLNRFSLENAAGYVYTYGHYSRYGPYSKYGPDARYGAYTGAPAKKKKTGLLRRPSAGDGQA